jgi:hypothetical protein
VSRPDARVAGVKRGTAGATEIVWRIHAGSDGMTLYLCALLLGIVALGGALPSGMAAT